MCEHPPQAIPSTAPTKLFSAHASAPRYSPLAEQFSQQFPGHDLPSTLAKFSLPVSLSEFRNPLDAPMQEVGTLLPLVAEGYG